MASVQQVAPEQHAPSTNGHGIPVENPATGQVIATVPDMGADEVRAIRVSACGRERVVVRIVRSEAQQREHADGEDHNAQDFVAGFASRSAEARGVCLSFCSCSSHLVIPRE